MEAKNKDRIQNDIDHRADQHREHSGFGKALTGNEHIKAQRDLHRDRSEQIDAEIADCIIDRLAAGSKQHKERLLHDRKDRT